MRRKRRRNLDNKIGLWLRQRLNQTRRRNKKPMYTHCYGKRIYRILLFPKGFYGLADLSTVFQERMHKTQEFKQPACVDDIVIVTKGTAEKHETEVKETMKKLEDAGYRLHPKCCEFF